MLRLSPLPDESAMGFMGRVQRLNGWTSERNAREWLFQWAASERPSDGLLCLVEVLAMVAGIDITSFVRDHTTLSFRRAVVISQTEVLHGSPSHRQLLEKRALCDARPGAYFCRECVKEDCDFHGAPYWRRSHQLPGVFWCQKHLSALSVARPVRAMHSLPTDFLEDCEEVSGEWVEELKEFEGIRNFLAISNDLLMRPRPLDELHVARAVRARCLELERRNSRGVTQSQRQIRDLIEAKFDARWLEKVSVEVGRTPEQLWKTLNRAISGTRAGVNSVGYALIFSGIFESADEAVNTMFDSPAMYAKVSAPTSTIRRFDDDSLRAAYIATEGSHVKMARMLGLSRPQVKQRMKELGLPPLGRNDFAKIRAVFTEVWEGNTTLAQASAKHGLTLRDMQLRLGDVLHPFMVALTRLQSKPTEQKAARKRSAAREREVPVKESS